MSCHWQTIMQCFDPVALTIGSFQITWYAILFLVAWQAAFQVVVLFEKHTKQSLFSRAEWEELSWLLLFAGFLGARLGFAVFYEPTFFLSHPSRLFLPYDFMTQAWVPIRGMSFHGGLLGVAILLCWYTRKKQKNFWQVTDRLVVVAPLVSFFGRIGNFLNQELPGVVTSHAVGVYFPGDVFLRHPVMLYSALGEGLFLFGWMLFWKKRIQRQGGLTFLYILSYAGVRILLEMWRQPDPGVALLFGSISRGQALSFFLIIVALIGWFWLKKHDTIRDT